MIPKPRGPRQGRQIKSDGFVTQNLCFGMIANSWVMGCLGAATIKWGPDCSDGRGEINETLPAWPWRGRQRDGICVGVGSGAHLRLSFTCSEQVPRLQQVPQVIAHRLRHRTTHREFIKSEQSINVLRFGTLSPIPSHTFLSNGPLRPPARYGLPQDRSHF